MGAGKTTFLKEVLKKPELKNERLLLMVNDYGLENYDAQELRQEGVELVEITAGCLCCSYKNQFEELLTDYAVRKDIDRVLIEPSGLFIPDQILGAFGRAPIRSNMSLEPIITIIDYQFWSGKKLILPACERLIEAGQLIVRNKLRPISTQDRHLLDERIRKLTTAELLDFDDAVINFLNLEQSELDVGEFADESIDHEVRYAQKKKVWNLSIDKIYCTT